MTYDAQFLSDYIEISQLSARYNQLSDAGDGPAYAQLFTADGSWESGPVESRLRRVGPDELAANCAAMGKGIVHVTTNPYVEIDGDRATQTCKMLIFTAMGERNDYIGTGTYFDTLVRTPQGWRFQSRLAVMDRV